MGGTYECVWVYAPVNGAYANAWKPSTSFRTTNELFLIYVLLTRRVCFFSGWYFQNKPVYQF